MGTIVKILGQEEVKKENKKIEFVKCMSNGTDLLIFNPGYKPNAYKNIELICKGSSDLHYDVMFAYDDNREFGIIYFGHFNDGEV